MTKCLQCHGEDPEAGEVFCYSCRAAYGRVLLKATIEDGTYFLQIVGVDRPLYFSRAKLEGSWVMIAGGEQTWADGVFPVRSQIALSQIFGVEDTRGISGQRYGRG